MMGSTAAEFDQLPPALRKKVSTETVSPSHSFLVLPYDLGKNPELVPIYPNETPNRCNVAASCRAGRRILSMGEERCVWAMCCSV
jgi:hypothetical protein